MSAIDNRLEDLPLTSNGLLALFGTFLSIIAVAFLISRIQGAATVRNKRHGSRPPKLPYAIPLLGHLPEFLMDTLKFLARATYVECGTRVRRNWCTK